MMPLCKETESAADMTEWDNKSAEEREQILGENSDALGIPKLSCASFSLPLSLPMSPCLSVCLSLSLSLSESHCLCLLFLLHHPILADEIKNLALRFIFLCRLLMFSLVGGGMGVGVWGGEGGTWKEERCEG